MSAMTENQWEMERRRLIGAVTRARNKAKLAPTLAEKIELQRKTKEAQQALHQHLLALHDLVSGGRTFDIVLQKINA